MPRVQRSCELVLHYLDEHCTETNMEKLMGHGRTLVADVHSDKDMLVFTGHWPSINPIRNPVIQSGYYIGGQVGIIMPPNVGEIKVFSRCMIAPTEFEPPKGKDEIGYLQKVIWEGILGNERTTGDVEFYWMKWEGEWKLQTVKFFVTKQQWNEMLSMISVAIAHFPRPHHFENLMI